MAAAGGIIGFPDLNDPLLVQLAEYVREMLRDYPELNRLTSGYDHAPRHIKWAIIDTMSDWLGTPPFCGQTLEVILQRGWLSLFCKGVIISLLTGLGLLHTRNFFQYSDGGVRVETENPQMIQAWLQMFKNEYEEKKQRALMAMNIDQALGLSSHGVFSEYLGTNSFFGYH